MFFKKITFSKHLIVNLNEANSFHIFGITEISLGGSVNEILVLNTCFSVPDIPRQTSVTYINYMAIRVYLWELQTKHSNQTSHSN